MEVMNKIKMEKYSEYKDSGVEWLGDIPKHWKVNRLGYIANCFPSNVDKHSKVNEKEVRLCNYTDVYKNDFITDDMSLMKATATDDQIKKFTLEKGDIVITKDSETASDIAVPTYISEELTNVICGYHLSVIKPYSIMYGKYLFRALQAKIFNIQFELCSNGITRVGLGVSDLKKGQFLVPPLKEQTAIAEFLDRKTALIDQAINIKQEQIKLLKERKQGLIYQAIIRGLNRKVKMKNSGMEGLGDIPKHWQFKRLKYLLKERNERSQTGEETLFMMSQIHGLVVRSDYHSKAVASQNTANYKKVYTGDLVFNKLKSHLGVFFKSKIDKVGIVSPDYAVYYSMGEIIDLTILEVLFRHPTYIQQFVCLATGVVEGLTRLYTGELFSLKIPVPPKEEQLAIVEFIEKIKKQFNKAIELKQQEIAKLKEYKSTLINSAVTGKIKVS